jgi:hypothetical protein
MTKTTIANSKIQLINPKSYFDNNVFTKSSFDRDIVVLIEKGSKNSDANPLFFGENIAELFLGEIKEVSVDLFSKIRNGLFYLIMMMDYATHDPEMMFTLQMMATHMNDFYCEALDKGVNVDLDLVRKELDKIEAFQCSQDCAAPNVLKDNFIEGFKNKELKKWAKERLINVEFQRPDDFDEVAEEGFLKQMKLTADDYEKMIEMNTEELTQMLNSKIPKPKLASKKPKSKKQTK